MPKPGKLRNVPLKRLSSVYKRTSPKERCMDESSDTNEHSYETSWVQCNDSERLPAYLEDSILEILVWEDYCTFRYGGKDHFKIFSRQLLELRTTRRLYQHVRECLNLEKHMSLRLECVDCRPCRVFNRFNTHEVWCDDSEGLPAYLEAAILEISVHP